jgi:hypothetical protein
MTNESNVYVGQWLYSRTCIGHVSNTGCGGTPHLHMVAYKNVTNPNSIPYCCSSTSYAQEILSW